MKILFFANRMPDLCGAFLHDIDLATELIRRGHQVIFLTIKIPPMGVNGDTYRGFRYLHYSAGSSFLDTSNIWICPHAPVLPDVRKLNSRGYNRPIIATCHYDGNYLTITRNGETGWVEMLLFINGIMEPNYRKNISPWPRQIIRTAAIRPIMHREQIVINEEHHGEYITLVNANENKGVHQFLDMARRMPNRKFLGILPYYGNVRIPATPPANIKWIPFDNDIRNVLKETRILLMPSYYESFGRVAVEAMINGIPVIYSKPLPASIYPGGSTEGIQAWIGEAGIQANRDNIEEWAEQIRRLDDEDVYSARSIQCKNHIESLNLFTEASRIAEMVETFSRENPVVVKVQQSSATPQVDSQREAPRLRQPAGPVGFGFSNGRLKIQR